MVADPKVRLDVGAVAGLPTQRYLGTGGSVALKNGLLVKPIRAGLLLLASCTTASVEPPPPPPPPLPIAIVNRPAGTDTVDARPVQALVIVIHRPSGALATGVTVRVTALPVGPSNPLPSMLVREAGTTAYSEFIAPVTDDRGQTVAQIRFGTVTGPARVEILVPELGVADTAAFVVVPGDPTGIVVSPRDTAIRVGLAFQVRGATVDRFGNRRTDPIEFVARASPAGSSTISTAGLLTPTEPGLLTVVGSARTFRDSLTIVVVPDSRFLMFDNYNRSISMAAVDGHSDSVIAHLDPSVAPEADWSRDRSRVVIAPLGPPPAWGIDIARLGGPTTAIRWPPSNLVAAYFPAFNPDASVVYFTGLTPTNAFRLYRIRADGSQLELFLDCECYHPTVSPDGRLLLVQQPLPQGIVVRVVDIATRAFVGPPITPGLVPEWSPAGDRFAFVDELFGRLLVMNADGTNVRVLTPFDHRYLEGQLAWSPDGKWIVARAMYGLELVDAATGLTLPLNWTTDRFYPAWR